MPKLVKTLEFRQVEWLDEDSPDNLNLEQLARDAWDKLPTQTERTIKQSDQCEVVGLRSEDFRGKGFALHCATYTDKQGVGTIPMPPRQVAKLGKRNPSKDENFLQFDFMALIKDNHVICLNCGRNAARLRRYLMGLFSQAYPSDNTHDFALLCIADLDTVAMIEAFGVKKVDMKVGFSEMTADALRENGHRRGGMWQNVIRSAENFIETITSTDERVKKLKQSQRGTVGISISMDKDDLVMTGESLNYLAEDIYEDASEDDTDDSFVIHLGDGKTKIKPKETSVRKAVGIEAAANSVDVQDAWTKMIEYFDSLKRDGYLEV